MDKRPLCLDGVIPTPEQTSDVGTASAQQTKLLQDARSKDNALRSGIPRSLQTDSDDDWQ